jgi:hypothetical protein
MNGNVVENIIESIDNENLEKFENLISKIKPESLGEKVFKK